VSPDPRRVDRSSNSTSGKSPDGGTESLTREHRGRSYPISPAHPVADVLPWMADDDLQALADDIRDRGQKLAIKQLPDGRIIDGRNRELACRIAGIGPWYERVTPNESEIPALVASLNVHRRHLTSEQKRQFVEAILRAEPHRSNRSVATTANVSHHTVAAVRDELESTGQLAQLKTTVGRDGRSRSRRSRNADGEPGDHKAQEGRGKRRNSPSSGRHSTVPPPDHTPIALQDLQRVLKRLDALARSLASEDTLLGRTFAEELRGHGVALKVDTTPFTDIPTGQVAQARRVQVIPILEQVREAVEATAERLKSGKAVRK
jgi:hypothetical protein